MRLVTVCGLLVSWTWSAVALQAELRVGAVAADVTPTTFPATINGGFLSRTANRVVSKLYARSIVVDDGEDRLAIVVVDSCMMPRPFLDEVKQRTAQRTKIRPDRILIAATHTHTAPSVMGALGTPVDVAYLPLLREEIAQSIVEAEARLEPAEVGFGVEEAADFTASRRWIRRPDRIGQDPFGNYSVRANMHSANNWDNVTGPSGPEDPDLSLIAFRSTSGKPIAVLANFSMHYYSGQQPVSSDYFGVFCSGLEQRLHAQNPEFVALMSHGCSGDIWRRDYTKPKEERGDDVSMEDYTRRLLRVAMRAYQGVEYEAKAGISMAESRFSLKYRVPNAQLLQWAEKIVSEMGDRPPKSQQEVYALEQIILHERQQTEVVVQALQIGRTAIATTPNETYALTGIKLKRQSPVTNTMVIELANGGDGYIPPPEQHHLGGYNTWPARSAGLEVQAEPIIVAQALQLLEEVSGQPRRAHKIPHGKAAQDILAAAPLAYWRMHELGGTRAVDAGSAGNDGRYEPGVAFFLEGPAAGRYCVSETNRAVHFAGGRLQANLPLPDEFTLTAWIWNGMPNQGRDVSGWFFSSDHANVVSRHGIHLGVGGLKDGPGKLLLQLGDKRWTGEQTLGRWQWTHVALVHANGTVAAFANGKQELTAKYTEQRPTISDLFVGGRTDNQSNWEGRLDEVAILPRALSIEEIRSLSQQAEVQSP